MIQKISNLPNFNEDFGPLSFSSTSEIPSPVTNRISDATASLEICQFTLRIDITTQNTYLKFGLLLDTLLTACTRQHHPGYPRAPPHPYNNPMVHPLPLIIR